MEQRLNIRLCFCIYLVTFYTNPFSFSFIHMSWCVRLAPPVISGTSGVQEMTVMAGQEVDLQCRVSGHPLPTVEWSHDGEWVNDTHNYMLLPSSFCAHVCSSQPFSEFYPVMETLMWSFWRRGRCWGSSLSGRGIVACISVWPVTTLGLRHGSSGWTYKVWWKS